MSGLDRLPLGPLAHIPVLGPVLFDQDFVIYMTLPLFAAMQLFFSHSMIGLRLKAVGDSRRNRQLGGRQSGTVSFLRHDNRVGHRRRWRGLSCAG